MRTTLTLARLAALKDVTRETWLRDRDCPDLMVRGRPGRAPLFVCEYRIGGRRSRMSLGEAAPNLAALQTARDAAMLARKQAREGIDPLHLRRRAHHSAAVSRKDTFRSLHDAYIAAKRESGLRWLPEMVRTFRADVLPAFGDRAMVDLTPDDAERLLRSIKERGAERQALVVFELLGRMMRWAVKDRRLQVNPFEAVRAPGKHKERDRTLDAGELGLVWRATAAPLDGMFDAVRLLLLTGLRRQEIGGARWSEIVDLDGPNPLLVIPGARMKNGRPHRVPLSPPAVAILRGLPSRGGDGYLFPSRSTKSDRPASGWSKMKRRLDAEIGRLCKDAEQDVPEAFVLHDFRRSLGSWAPEAGFRKEVASLILAHAKVAGMTEVDRIYMRFELLPERRALLCAWAEYIIAQAEGRPAAANVVALRSA